MAAVIDSGRERKHPAQVGLELPDSLAELLEVKPPKGAGESPPILAFERKREVEIPWGNPVPVNALRAHFEKSWGFENASWDELKDRLSSAIVVLEQPKTTAFRANFVKDAVQTAPVAGIALREGTSGRLYLLTPRKDLKLTKDDFLMSAKDYKTAWRDKVSEVELVFESDADARQYFTAYEEIELRPAAILRRYKELSVQLQMAQGTLDAVRGVDKKKIDTVTVQLVDNIVQKKSELDDLERFQNWVRQLEMAEYDARRQIERLAADAARLGYHLQIDADRTIASPDRGNVAVQKGKLYVIHKRTARWNTAVVVKPVWFLPWTWMTVRQAHEQIVDSYDEVDVNRDILAEKRKAWVNEGKQVFVFEPSPAGFVTVDGVMTLREVMHRCADGEDFRRACIVVLPVYEESLTGERMLAKYNVFVRPLPGMIPAMLPRLSLVESLTYRIAWKEAQVGELASSVNLAPGEERQITISKSFEQETTVSRTSASIFDIARTESNDLATEMENQTRQEQEHSSSLQFSSKASGGWGPFSAEASTTAGTTSSLKNMSQSLNKVAKKASQSVSQQNRQEISTSRSARTKITNVEETVAKLRNINQGRSLNLMFYRLYNKYDGGLFLEDLRFEVVPAVETIAGSGVHESRSYSLEDLPRVIEDLRDAGVRSFKGSKDYAEMVFESIETLLCNEYYTDTTMLLGAVDSSSARKATTSVELLEATTSVKLLHVPGGSLSSQLCKGAAGDVMAQAIATPLAAAEAAAPPQALDQRVEALARGLRMRKIDNNIPVIQQELLVMAPGLYLDAVVGARPSTEPYSEQMREQEVNLRRAEVFVKEAEGLYQKASAMRIAHTDGANFLVGVLPDPQGKRLMLAVEAPLVPTDEWQLVVDDKVEQKIPLDSTRNIVELSWDEPPKWLARTDSLVSRIKLVNKKGEMIAYPTAPMTRH